MLNKLTLEGVGPAQRLDAEFAQRLNLITGDNGLGKSFLLDVAWWGLTRSWPREGEFALPRTDARAATITTQVTGRNNRPVERAVPFDFKRQQWVQPEGRPQVPGLVLFAQVDGGFSVWDPARNYWRDGDPARPSAYRFDSRQVWHGLQENGQWRCNGLYRDWASWQLEKNEAFKQLSAALERLSPPDAKLVPGLLRRLHPDDAQDYPTIHMPYGIDVPVVHASAAIRRILALAYLLIWAWQEHRTASALRREKPAHRVILLLDEVEAHLHPSWQKRILPSILAVVDVLTQPSAQETRPPSIQVLASTHSPLVCVSVEPAFDDERDALFDLDLHSTAGVLLQRRPFAKRGTSERWLLSEHFDLDTPYAAEVKDVLDKASALAAREIRHPGSVKRLEFKRQDDALRKHLPDDDLFWVRWRKIGEKKGWLR